MSFRESRRVRKKLEKLVPTLIFEKRLVPTLIFAKKRIFSRKLGSERVRKKLDELVLTLIFGKRQFLKLAKTKILEKAV